MKEIPIAVEKFLVILIFTVLLSGCKNSDKESDNWFSGGDDFTGITAAELEEGWASLPKGSLEYPEEVEEFYSTRSYAPVWNAEEMRSAFAEELSKAEEEGLSSEDYLSQRLQDLIRSTQKKGSGDQLAFEILLTDSFFKYAHDLYYGKLNPRKLHTLWGLKREDLKLPSLLDVAAREENITGALDSLKPQHPVYEGLKESLREYKVLKEKDSAVTRVEEGETIKPGDQDPRIAQVAKRLMELGLVQLDSLENDSVYSKRLVTAVKRFQEENDLQPDGIIGTSTIDHLNRDNSQLYNKILVNLERWRWYPRDLGEHYILVNVADFKLAVVKDGDTVRTHNVIAGSKARQTPVFTDTLEYIVINPLWNIPPTIQKEDIVPKASKDPSYLTRNNMTVTAPNGEVLDPYKIDWSSSKVKNYRFSQSAGPSNPLGRVKIIYPNKYLIYLHDTPSKALFNRSDRAESSGCVRVENAIDLAAYVVENQDAWSKKQIQEQIASGETKHVKIKRPIQVHHFYWTAWRGLDKTYFSDDVYDLDEKVYKALTATP